MVEADGEWHTSDNKYASAGWRASHPQPNGVKSSKSASPRKEPEKTALPPSASSKPPNAPPPQEIISLDSDSDDEGIVKRELSPTSGYTTSHSQSVGLGGSRLPPPPPPPRASASIEVIDLTLDSDQEETPPPPPAKPAQKRKERESDPTAVAPLPWKRPRYSGPSGSGSGASGMYTNGVGGSSSSGGEGVNGSSHTSSYGASESGGTNGWGPVRIPPSAPTQYAYRAPHSHAAPSPPAMPVHSQSMNTPYANCGPGLPRSMNLPMARAPLPARMTPYHGGLYEQPPTSHRGGNLGAS